MFVHSEGLDKGAVFSFTMKMQMIAHSDPASNGTPREEGGETGNVANHNNSSHSLERATSDLLLPPIIE